MAKILLTLTGNPSNMGASQLFDNQAHFDSWINEHKDNLLPNAIVDGQSLTFGTQDDDGKWSGSGKIESKPDDFQN